MGREGKGREVFVLRGFILLQERECDRFWRFVHMDRNKRSNLWRKGREEKGEGGREKEVFEKYEIY